MTSASITSQIEPNRDTDYETLLANLQRRVDALQGPLFTVHRPGLYDIFLAHLPDDQVQYNTCSACRQFVRRYGNLVTIAEDGTIQSALWHEDDAPGIYKEPVTTLRLLVENAPVDGVFYDKATAWGQPVTGPWRHLAAQPPAALVFTRATQTPNQAWAEKAEDYRTLCRALADFTPEMLQTAVTLLRSESLYRSEKVLGVAEWLQQLHARRADTKHQILRDTLTWRAVATAPAGYCHPRSSMIGTLLDDIAAGMPYDDIAGRFKAKMHPLQYQRPQAAPKAGNIAQAEKVVAQLDAAGALARRFARVEEIQALWRPTPPRRPAAGAADGVFSHLLPAAKQPAGVSIPPTTITWVKFRDTVLSQAERIECKIVHGHNTYAALVTAADPNAPPILQWDREEQRNPFSWYLYHNGSPGSAWNLHEGSWVSVTAVALQPNLWGEQPLNHQGQGVLFVLEGARDMRPASAGAGLFPECLKAEFHGVRATIEAYSKRATIADAEQASACGLILQKSNAVAWNAHVRVAMAGSTVEYQIDRWD
ncbi:MAG: hypothetical protein IPP13_22175 [Kouleothrix sp.]|jgi:hypothetical protein|nr:hypothetical protein [Kouleothrix sp.]